VPFLQQPSASHGACHKGGHSLRVREEERPKAACCGCGRQSLPRFCMLQLAHLWVPAARLARNRGREPKHAHASCSTHPRSHVRYQPTRPPPQRAWDGISQVTQPRAFGTQTAAYLRQCVPFPPNRHPRKQRGGVHLLLVSSCRAASMLLVPVREPRLRWTSQRERLKKVEPQKLPSFVYYSFARRLGDFVRTRELTSATCSRRSRRSPWRVA